MNKSLQQHRNMAYCSQMSRLENIGTCLAHSKAAENKVQTLWHGLDFRVGELGAAVMDALTLLSNWVRSVIRSYCEVNDFEDLDRYEYFVGRPLRIAEMNTKIYVNKFA